MTLKGNTIQRKLVKTVLLISGAVLLLASTTILSYEFVTFRQTTLQQAATIGEIIAANSTAALAFENPDDAKEILSALKAELPTALKVRFTRPGVLVRGLSGCRMSGADPLLLPEMIELVIAIVEGTAVATPLA